MIQRIIQIPRNGRPRSIGLSASVREPRGTAHNIGSHADTLAPAFLGRNHAAKAAGELS
jgi:hypothetical protein